MNEMATMTDQLPADMASFDMSGFDQAAGELSPGDPVVRYINSKWVWQTEEKVRLEIGQKLAVNLWLMERGWLRFEGEGSDTKLAERRLGKVADKYRPEPRDQLGFTDKALWKKDKEGQPMDPWVHTWQFPAILIGQKGNYQVQMAGTSRGWERSVGALIQQWKAQQPTNMGKVPVIELSTREGRTAHGDRDFPVMTIMDWKSLEEFKVSDTPSQAAPDPEPKPAMF